MSDESTVEPSDDELAEGAVQFGDPEPPAASEPDPDLPGAPEADQPTPMSDDWWKGTPATPTESADLDPLPDAAGPGPIETVEPNDSTAGEVLPDSHTDDIDGEATATDDEIADVLDEDQAELAEAQALAGDEPAEEIANPTPGDEPDDPNTEQS